jgi:hypothetical protein
MDALFARVVEQQGATPFGRVLDAGTGKHSLEFVCGLATTAWTAVTGDNGEVEYLQAQLGQNIRPQDRLIMGNWANPDLLRGEVFDVVLADYLLGAVERVAPYFQEELLARLRPHVGHRLYLIGLEPLPLAAQSPGARALLDLHHLADVTRVLTGEPRYREYPQAWVEKALARTGFSVVDTMALPNVYRVAAVQRQVDANLARIATITDPALRSALQGWLATLADTARSAAQRDGGITLGQDYVITAALA